MASTRPDPAPGSTSTLRSANQRRVLDILRSGAGSALLETARSDTGWTQADLARATGLAPATVSNIVRDLSGTGLLETDPGSGRRGSSVRIARKAGVVVGIDVGHSHVAVAVGDLTGQVLGEERRTVSPTAPHADILALARELVGRIDGDLASGERTLRQVTLGLPAPITGDVIRSAAISPGWDGVDARRVTEVVFAAPVIVENDANLGALAEHRRGVARGYDSSVFVKISSGVGAGIVLGNELYHGVGGTAGEIGHLTLDEQGPLCRCGGRGCLEAYSSTGTVLGMLADQLPGATLTDVIDAARAGGVAAQRALEDAGLGLGWGIASIVNLLNPAIVVIGGDMARAGDLVLDPARAALRRHALDAVAQTPVIASELHERASLVGAVLLAAERVDLGVD